MAVENVFGKKFKRWLPAFSPLPEFSTVYKPNFKV